MIFPTVCVIFLFYAIIYSLITLFSLVIKTKFYYNTKCTVSWRVTCFILLEEAVKPFNDNFKGQYL